MALLVFDFGGSAVKYGIWSDQEELLEQDKFPTPKTWEEMQQQLLTVLNEKKEKYSLTGVAISSPGAVKEEEGIVDGASAIPYIHGIPLLAALEELFALPVSIENDANCAALAELWKGSAKDVKNMLFIVLGTGVGGAVVANGKIIPGKHMLGGEFGFMLLTENQTFSDLATTVKLEQRYAKRLNLVKSLPAKEIFDLAKSGDSIAIEEVETFYYYLAKGIFNLQYSFDPELILLGGGVSVREDLIPEVYQRLRKLQEIVPIATVLPELATCQFYNDANMIGAVYHYYDKFNSFFK